MTRILFIGQKPETVDFSDPALPPGFNAQKINAGIALAVARIEERGWQGDTCMIMPDETAGEMIERQLAAARYDCVVIGGGLRIPPGSLVRIGGQRGAQGSARRCHRLQHPAGGYRRGGGPCYRGGVTGCSTQPARAEGSATRARTFRRTGDLFALWKASIRSISGGSPVRGRLTTAAGR